MIIAVVALDSIVAVTSLDTIAVAVPDKSVIQSRPDDVFEAGDGVTCGIPAGGRALLQVDTHTTRRTPYEGELMVGVGERILAAAAVQNVSACSALDEVVTAVPDESVVVSRPDDVLEVGDGVAAGAPAGGRTLLQVDIHTDRPILTVGERIFAGAAVQTVSAGIADDDVVAFSSVHRVVLAAPYQRIVA